MRGETTLDAGEGIVFHPLLIDVGKHAEPQSVQGEFRELVGDECAQGFGFDVLLGLDLAGEYLAIVLGKKLNLECGVVLAVVIGWDASYANKFLHKVVFGIGALELCKGIVTKEHVLGTRLRQQGKEAAVEQIDFESLSL